jgi:hypothetical protein
MKITDNIPIIIVISALIINIAIGVNNSISFTALMVRCIIVTIVFGLFGHMVTETVKNAIECSRLSKHEQIAEQSDAKEESKPTLDIKVPPLDDEEFISMDSDDNSDFVEVNPVFMGNYKDREQE